MTDKSKIDFLKCAMGYEVWAYRQGDRMQLCGHVRRLSQPLVGNEPWAALGRSGVLMLGYRTRAEAAEAVLQSQNP